jgi:DNA-binding transcriptional LysR family regulator
MDLRQLRFFVAVAEELHFGRAAQRLNISQPSLSLRIKSMEEELGVRLFERNRHQVKLSVAGEAALAETYRTLDQAARVRTSALQAERGKVAKLSIGCVPSALFAVLPPILNRLHALDPEIALSIIDIETAAALPAVREGRIDVGILRLEHAEAPLRGQPENKVG